MLNILANLASIGSLVISCIALFKVNSLEKNYNLNVKQNVRGNKNVLSGGDTNIGK